MGTGSDIARFFKWVDRARKLSERLDKLDEKLGKQESDIKDLSNLCNQIMRDVEGLKERYENITDTVCTEIENRLLKAQLAKLIKAKSLPAPKGRKKKK